MAGARVTECRQYLVQIDAGRRSHFAIGLEITDTEAQRPEVAACVAKYLHALGDKK